jgi:hypothetical protein
MWQGTNYLLRMKTDNDFFDQSDILTEWYGASARTEQVPGAN